MRHISVIICFLTLWSCGTDNTKEEKISNPLMTPTTVTGQKFFEFDEIDYYFNDYDENNMMELSDNVSRSELDSLKEGFIIGDIPHSMSDLSCLDKLVNVGYKKKSIEKSKFSDIQSVFSVKPTDEVVVTMCIYVYRDILVFKNKGKIVGVAKICFDCLGHQIIGTNANTNFFGQNGDFNKLSRILRK